MIVLITSNKKHKSYRDYRKVMRENQFASPIFESHYGEKAPTTGTNNSQG